MADSPKYLPTAYGDTFTDLQTKSGQLGQQGVAVDTGITYIHDGTNWIDMPLRKLNVKSGTPTLAMAPAGATGSITGNNLAGTITMTIGLSIATDPALFTLTLADGVSFPNKTIVQLQALDNNTVGVISSVFQSVANATSASVKAKGAAISVGATYNFSYIIMGY